MIPLLMAVHDMLPPSRGFDSIPDILSEIKRGKMVIITDDASRENEGDLICAAEKITASKINFMAKFGRGLICTPIEPKRASQLGLQRMVNENRESFETDFTISVDGAPNHGVSTGISAGDRSRTIRLLASTKTRPRDLVQPGHVFPLQAKSGGVLQRAGHTEAAVDLARLAGLDHSAVICEILKDNGELARLPDLKRFAQHHSLKIGCIQDLIEYRRTQEKLVEPLPSCLLETDHGCFRVHPYRSTLDQRIHLALVNGTLGGRQPVLVRVHSESLLHDVFGSRSGPVPHNLDLALKHISSEPKGVLLYLRTSDSALSLIRQTGELRTPSPKRAKAKGEVSAIPLREYGLGAQILYDLGVRRMKLLTDHPKHVVGLSGYGLQLDGQVPLTNPKRRRKKTSSRK